LADSLIEAAAQLSNPIDRRIFGVALAQVKSNFDSTGQGRVQLKLPWLPGFEPWARVAVLSAGDGRGTFFIPQDGDEVLVAFNQGNVNEPYVLGSLWNQSDPPPARLSTDARNKRIIRSPMGHRIELDDSDQSLKIETPAKHKIEITTDKIELSTSGGTAKLSLATDGTVTLKGMTIDISADSKVTIGGLQVDVTADLMAAIDGGANLDLQAATVAIN
jgi:uncharacterized protein involved in type VI secretion and phage assembly